jgi:hypothetical protein
MARPKGRTLPIRISVALSPAQFQAVSAIASEHASSVSWVVRRAVTEYVRRSGGAGDDLKRTRKPRMNILSRKGTG